MFLFLDNSTWSFFLSRRPHGATWYWNISSNVSWRRFPSGSWLEGWAAEGKSVVVYNWWCWFAPLGGRGWVVLLACQYWVMCAMCSISLLQKIVELSNNVVVCWQMSTCGRDRVLTAFDAFLCSVFLFKVARKNIFSVHKSHFLCLQKQTTWLPVIRVMMRQVCPVMVPHQLGWLWWQRAWSTGQGN